MITYNINRFIHSIIRDNKQVYLMELLISDWKKEDILFDDLIKQLKSFLQKENDLIFDESKLKYMVFLENFKKNIDNIKNLKEKNSIETNSLLFRLYDIPKKRNNLLLVFLMYFYINNKNKIWWNEIFKIIYIYFIIIIYRNRISEQSRKKFLEIDEIKFKTVKEIISEKIRFISRKYTILRSKRLKPVISILWIALLWFAGLNLSWNFLKADISWVANNATYWKIAFDSIMLWKISDPIISSIQTFWLQNILLLVAFALLIQSFKTSLSTVFFNSLLTKVFQFLWIVIKYLYRALFFIYDYITYKLETRFIFSFISFITNKKIVPNSIIILLFSIIYWFIYLFVVYLYIFFFIYILNIPFSLIYMILAWIVVSLLVIYLNFHNDLNNFKVFLIEIEAIIKEIYDKCEANKIARL